MYFLGKSKWSKEQKEAQEKGHHIVKNQGVWRLGQRTFVRSNLLLKLIHLTLELCRAD